MKAQEFREGLEKLGYDFFTGVPCSLLGSIIGELGDGYIPSVREDTALGLAAGAYLGGKKPCVLMQNSGIGYSLNVLTSLNLIYDIPVLLIISFRGFEGKDAPEHIIMGKHCVELMEAVGISSKVCGGPDIGAALAEADAMAKEGKPFALFIREGAVS
ncbi:MAG: sulfopyruvate decarboxylase subunit alpha [Candidatus Omnitrophica bacterium]|nr:sulfopyruvate decarboxylase subunit alpha [Candidatus Omnitrophota bacterium]MDD5737773.1 sulfopyruvate decarboxylase subunit alpha [Candidatus Omnitrophota bacterium]